MVHCQLEPSCPELALELWWKFPARRWGPSVLTLGPHLQPQGLAGPAQGYRTRSALFWRFPAPLCPYFLSVGRSRRVSVWGSSQGPPGEGLALQVLNHSPGTTWLVSCKLLTE